MREGERLGARVDLARAFADLAKHEVEVRKGSSSLRNLAAQRYVKRAESLFEDLGLEEDLSDLRKLK